MPRDRAGHFQSHVFERYQRHLPEVDQAIQTRFIKGLSTAAVGKWSAPCWTRTRVPRPSRAFFTTWRMSVPRGGNGRWKRLIGTFMRTGPTSRLVTKTTTTKCRVRNGSNPVRRNFLADTQPSLHLSDHLFSPIGCCHCPQTSAFHKRNDYPGCSIGIKIACPDVLFDPRLQYFH